MFMCKVTYNTKMYAKSQLLSYIIYDRTFRKVKLLLKIQKYVFNQIFVKHSYIFWRHYFVCNQTKCTNHHHRQKF